MTEIRSKSAFTLRYNQPIEVLSREEIRDTYAILSHWNEYILFQHSLRFFLFSSINKIIITLSRDLDKHKSHLGDFSTNEIVDH